MDSDTDRKGPEESPASTVAGPLAICPECGARADQVRTEKPHWSHVRSLAPWVIVLIILAIMAAFTAARAQTRTRTPRPMVFSGVLSFPDAPITRDQLAAMAAGSVPCDGLIDRLFPILRAGPRRTVNPYWLAHADFVAPGGQMSVESQWGWPWPVVHSRRTHDVTDVFSPIRQAAPADPQSDVQWHFGGTEISRESAVGEVWADTGPVAVALLLVLVLSIAAGRLRSMRPPRDRPGRRAACSRWRTRVGLIGVGVLTAGAAVQAFFPTTRVTRWHTPGTVQRMTALARSHADLRALADAPGGDRRFAELVLSVAAPSDAGAVLAVGSEWVAASSMQSTDVGWPLNVMSITTQSRSVRTPAAPFAAEELPPPRSVISWSGATVSRSSGSPHQAITITRVNFGAIAVCVLALWLVWRASHGACRLWHQILTRRRRAEQRCLNCGYDLRGA